MGEETAGLGPDARLVALRERLALARLEGVGFSDCWPGAMVAVLDDLSRLDRELYRRALNATRGCWQAAYEGRSSTRVDVAMSELSAYAADAELEPLAYEPAGP